MPWTISKSGQAQKIAQLLADEFGKLTQLPDDEAELKNDAAALVAKILAMQPGANVSVNCTGGGTPYTAVGWTHSIHIDVKAKA